MRRGSVALTAPCLYEGAVALSSPAGEQFSAGAHKPPPFSAEKRKKALLAVQNLHGWLSGRFTARHQPQALLVGPECDGARRRSLDETDGKAPVEPANPFLLENLT